MELCLRLLDQTADAYDLAAFLLRTIEFGIDTLHCSGGSAFLYDAASQRLELCAHDYSEALHLSVAPGEGVAGRAFRNGEMLIVSRAELSEVAVRLEVLRAESFSSIVAIPVPRGTPEAVFCFDFDPRAMPGRKLEGLTRSELAAAKKLACAFEKSLFCNVLKRVRSYDFISKIRNAGDGPGKLRQGASIFLSKLASVFRDAGKPSPDLACFQIVDWRRNTIRAVQGMGLPISFHSSVSHTLDCDDIQAIVTMERRLQIIVGNDQVHFDQDIYRKYKHDRFVRLWIPMFPIPEAWLVARAAGDVEGFLSRWILWGPEENRGGLAKAKVSRWNKELLDEPPLTLVYGTLELGYLRARPDCLDFEPLSLELATWSAVQAWRLSNELFAVTLPGSLEAIGHAAAVAVAEPTILTVAMPDWHPIERRYPDGTAWSVAVPIRHTAISPADAQSTVLTFTADDSDTNLAGENLHKIISAVAEEAVHLAHILDDYSADPYLLIPEIEDRNYVGTDVPDPKLEPLLREICREAGAEACAILEVDTESINSSSHLISGFSVTDTDFVKVIPSPSLAEQVREVTSEGSAWSGYLEDSAMVATILPLELADATHAALVLSYPSWEVLRGSRAIESRVARWVHRLSLRRLVVRDRFSTLMRRLRGRVVEARNYAVGRLPHLPSFVDSLFSRVETPGAVLVLYSTSPSGPDIVRRFWRSGMSEVGTYAPYNDIFVSGSTRSPSRRAIEERRLILYPPHDPRRKEETELVSQELLTRAAELLSRGEDGRASSLERIVQLAGGDTTMLIVPLLGQSGSTTRLEGALTVFLNGEHSFDPSQRQLILELAGLVAEGLGLMQQLDQQALEGKHSSHVERLRDLFGRAKTEDDIIGHLFSGMGNSTNPTSDDWGIANDVVLWILDQEAHELVVRSARGRGLQALAGSLVIEPEHHPFIIKAKLRFPKKKKKLPRLEDFPVFLFDLKKETEPICRSYGGLPGIQWLMSFALHNADGLVIGVVDCLRESRLMPEEEAALQVVLRRLSLQLCAAFERTRQQGAISFARRLTVITMDHLAQLCADDAYGAVVEMVRDEMGAAHCDLFLERDGKLVLHTTTRPGGPSTTSERYNYSHELEMVDQLASSGRRPRILHASSKAQAFTRMGGPLAALFSSDSDFERLVLPLQIEEGSKGSKYGILYLRGPLTITDGQRVLKKSGLFTREHLRRARDSAVVVQRLVTMAEFVEQQEWLVNELQHALGQPLQGLRKVGDDAIRILIARGATLGDYASLRLRLQRSSELVQEVRDQLTAFAKMGQPASLALKTVDLQAIVQDCCDFKNPEAKARGCQIVCADLQRIPFLPGDFAWIRQAILNLLDNAVKYSYANREVEVTLHENSKGEVRLVVSNYGIGIPSRDLSRVFDPYFRSRVPDMKGTRRGSGIGLAIVRHAIERLHRGRVIPYSKPASGALLDMTADQLAGIPHKTTFTVILFRSILERLVSDRAIQTRGRQ